MMMTVEQYLAVGYVWQAEKQDGYNPFEDNYADLQNKINMRGDGQLAEDGRIDYQNNINEIDVEDISFCTR